MKRIALVALGMIAIAAIIGYFSKTSPQVNKAAAMDQVSSDQAAVPTEKEIETVAVKADSSSNAAAVPHASAQRPVAVPAPAAPAATLDSTDVRHSIDILLAPGSTYGQKQTAWQQLIKAGNLDDAIAALEAKRAAEPLVADYAATLGQGYLKKCATIQDVREQAILAMQADKLFDTALELDASNWEARFTKAAAMSYWPANLNKGEEVIDDFRRLIQQQELQASRPEFAETYLWLGDQLQKTGQSQDAVAIWGRGASLFPAHEALQHRLARQPGDLER